MPPEVRGVRAARRSRSSTPPTTSSALAAARPGSRSCARSRSRRTTATSSRPAATRRARGPTSTSTRRSRARLAQGLVVAGDRMSDVRRRRRRLGRGRRRRRGRARASAAATCCCSRPAPHLTAADFTRLEAKANHTLFWPLRFGHRRTATPVAFLAGRCVGGTTTINTKVALRAHEQDVAKWHEATGLTNERGEPFSAADLAPYYDRVEAAARRARAERLDEERPHGRARRSSALGARARVGARVHRRELHALRLVPPGLPDERRQVDAEHLHPPTRGRAGCSTCARTRTSSACWSTDGTRDRRRVRRRRRRAARRRTRTRSSSPAAR